jgi:hypothetical protein
MANNFPGTCYYTLTLVIAGSTQFQCRYAGHFNDASFPCSASMTRKECVYSVETTVTISKTCSPSTDRGTPTGSIKRTLVSPSFTGRNGVVIPQGYYIKISCLQSGAYTGCYYYDPYYYYDPDIGWVGQWIGTPSFFTPNAFQYVSARLTNSATGVVTPLNAYIVDSSPFVVFLGTGPSSMIGTMSNGAAYYDIYLYNSIVQSAALGTSRDFANAAPCLSC